MKFGLAALLLGVSPLFADIIVGDFSGSKLHRYSDAGADLGIFVSSGAGSLMYPGAFTFSSDGDLYVTSRGNHRLLKFDGTDGSFVGQVGGTWIDPTAIAYGPDSLIYLATGNGTVEKIDPTSGLVVGTIWSVGETYGLTFDSTGNMLTTNFGSGMVRKFDRNSGAFLGVHSTGYTGPVGIANGPGGKQYVAQQGSHKVGASDGTSPVLDFASGFSYPSYLAWSPSTLYVSEYVNRRISFLDASGQHTGGIALDYSPYGLARFPDAASASAVPEPGSFLLAATAFLGIAIYRRKK